MVTDRSRLPGLDGLRAIAISGVLVFHLHAAWLPGGFLGVDVFFVVSGFLITTLLLRELDHTGRVNLGSFYLRRARRLLPALALTILGSVVVAALVERDLLLHVGRQTMGAVFFVSNWVEIAAGSNYFEAAQPLLFMNFWSLAVEEQFYLFWPVALTVLVTFTRRWPPRVATVLVTAGVSALLMALLFRPESSTRVYYGTDTHLFGLMLGAALALAWASPRRAGLGSEPWRRAATPVLIAALAVLGLAMVLMSETSALTFRGGILVASLATVVLIAALLVGPPWWVAAMERQPLTWLGERSYGIYLWHWPVVLVTDAAWETTPGSVPFLVGRAFAVVMTLTVAAASYRFVEMPIRRQGFRTSWARGAAALAGPAPMAARSVAAGASVLVLSACVAMATAPSTSSTQAQAEQNLDLIRRSQADAGAPVLPASQPKATPGRTQRANGTSSSSSRGQHEGPTTPPRATSQQRPVGGMFDGTRADARYPPAVPYPELDHVTANTAFTMPTGKEISVFGDSMIATTAGALDWYFPGVRMDAESNRQWSDGLAAVKADGNKTRRAVVLAFGTNAGVKETALRATLDILGPDRMVVLVALHGRSDWIPESNALLRKVAHEHPNVVVAAWDKVATTHPDVLQSDRVHPDQHGAHPFAKALTAAFAGLSERATGRAVPWSERAIP